MFCHMQVQVHGKEYIEGSTVYSFIADQKAACSVSVAELVEEDRVEPNRYTVSNPVFVNPCSYDAVNAILIEIGKNTGIPKYNGGVGTREFVIIYCDGSPYNLCFRVIMSTYRCLCCGEVICGEEKANSHIASVHAETDNPRSLLELEYDWALIQPGPGHIEMNMIKAITNTCWDIFWKVLAQSMNFKSEKALQCCRQVTDHHKGWQLFTIAYEALSRELVLPFVREELRKDQPKLSALEFANFQKHQVSDRNYSLLLDLTFELMAAIATYRAGIRHCKPELMSAGLNKFSKLWSGGNNPLYRELEMSFSVSLARMPDTLLELVRRTWSINTSGISGTNEGPDFKLETINKTIQNWLPAVPSGKDWMQCCAQHDDLLRLRQKLFHQLGSKDPKARGRHQERNLQHETLEFRAVLREHEYLSQPRSDRTLVSIDGRPLDPEVVRFSDLCREKRALYCRAYLGHEKRRSVIRTAIPFREPPVFICPEERTEYERVENKTIDQLKEDIPVLIACIAEVSLREAFSDARTLLHSMKK